jgi:hypothetical protein
MTTTIMRGSNPALRIHFNKINVVVVVIRMLSLQELNNDDCRSFY